MADKKPFHESVGDLLESLISGEHTDNYARAEVLLQLIARTKVPDAQKESMVEIAIDTALRFEDDEVNEAAVEVIIACNGREELDRQLPEAFSADDEDKFYKLKTLIEAFNNTRGVEPIEIMEWPEE